MTVRALVRGAALAVLAGAACARPYPPPGGEPPRDAPMLIETAPEALAIEAGYRGAVVFRFDRRLSAQGEPNPVIVSPSTSEVQVRQGRTELRVTLENGWESGQIYRVIVLPGIRDLFGNRTTEPLELVFSTGPEIPQTAVAGIVTDRLTGRPPRNAMIEATRLADSLVYVTAADTAGFFSLRHLPRGEYETVAFVDANRNRRRDASEPSSPAEHVSFATATDTVPVLLAVLPPDTTPARLVRAEWRDSLHVRLHFDDAFDPDAELTAAEVQLRVLPDSAPGPRGMLLTPAQFEKREQARAAADTVAIVDDTARARPAAAAREPRPPLPSRELVLVPLEPLRPDTEYLVVVSDVTNINEVPGGGGEATFRVPARQAEPPDR
jgi:hypothetical protein